MQTDETLLQIVYVSKPTGSMTIGDVRKLLIEAKVKNHFRGVTGILLFDGEFFVQVLEGPKDTVMALHEKIERDPRHTQFTSLTERSILQRDFGEWSMGLAHIDSEELKSLPGLIDIRSARKILSRSGAAESLVAMVKSRYGASAEDPKVV